MCGKLFLKNSEDKTQVDSVDTTWHIIRNYPWTWQTFLLHKYSKLKRQTIQCLQTCSLNPKAVLISNIQKKVYKLLISVHPFVSILILDLINLYWSIHSLFIVNWLSLLLLSNYLYSWTILNHIICLYNPIESFNKNWIKSMQCCFFTPQRENFKSKTLT